MKVIYRESLTTISNELLMCEKIGHDLVCGVSLSTPPVSPVLDGDHLILGQGVPRGHLEYPPQLLRGQHGVSLQRGIVNNIIMLN